MTGETRDKKVKMPEVRERAGGGRWREKRKVAGKKGKWTKEKRSGNIWRDRK